MITFSALILFQLSSVTAYGQETTDSITSPSVLKLREEFDSLRRQQARLQADLNREGQDRRRLQGQIEEMGFQLKGLEKRLNDLVSALDLRLQEIEDNIEKTQEQQAQTSATVQNLTTRIPTGNLVPSNKPETDSQNLTNSNSEQTADNQQNLGTLKIDQTGKVIDSSIAQQKPNFEEQYNKAITQIQQTNYSAARSVLQSLYQQDPQNPLSSNVLYWLGETYYVEENYKLAMSEFARSVVQYPQGAKYLDSLLKIGLSLGELNRLENACTTLIDMENRADKLPDIIALHRQKALKKYRCANPSQ